ncbi:MAG: diacylglycerol kinase [Alphaproteobacteria bacterium]|nr:diacylglycerol kinase [Alphaproteobacteria bacterium]
MTNLDLGTKHFLHAFKHSYDGFVSAFKTEIAFRQDCVIFVIGLLLLPFIPAVLWQKALLISVLLFVLLMELVNTAIEAVIDRISPEYHELSKKAKDIGSLLVFLAYINSSLIWAAVLYDVFIK